MTAVITDFFKNNIVRYITDGISDSSERMYIGLGRAEYWDSSDTPPIPTNSMKDIRGFRQSLQAVKKITDSSYVVPRLNWTTGTSYTSWDDTNPTSNYYVMTENYGVYMCLRVGKNNLGVQVGSTVEPTGSNNDAFVTADGYVWKFLYTISAIEANYFLSANYMPVSRIVGTLDSDATGIQIKHKEIQTSATPGEISNIVVTNSGTGYTSKPTITIDGNGTATTAIATIDSASGGTIAKIEFENDSSTIAMPYGYNYANVTITGGGGLGGLARPVISPPKGFGADAPFDLSSDALMIHAKIAGTEEDFITVQDFRQVGLIRNPLKGNGTDSDFTADTGNALQQLVLSSTSVAFSVDKTVVGANSGSKAYIDRVDSNNLYFHQTDTTGYGAFTLGETLTESNGSGQGILGSTIDSSEVEPFSGDVLYIDNRTAVERMSNQTEDIKIILQL
jgi:hypothetical protein